MTKIPAPPKGTKAAGKKLWEAVLTDYHLEQHEEVLLQQAVRTADLCADLQAIVDRDGPMLDGRTHPAVVELRAQRITLARLVVALRVPLGEDTEQTPRTQRRGVRGVYALRGGAA